MSTLPAPLDPQQKNWLDILARRVKPFPDIPLEELNAEQWRANSHIRFVLGDEALKSIEDKKIPGPNGDIPVRVYVPEAQESPLPVLVYCHGGCWYLCNLDTHDAYLRRLANIGKFIICSVDYRQCPEHKFPIPLEDVYTAVCWAFANAASMGGDPRLIGLGGDSCGANLSAGTTLLLKERGGPRLALQLLLYPMTDHYEPGTESLKAYALGHGYDAAQNNFGWDNYGCCEAPHGSKENPDYHAAVLRAPDLSGLPPAHVVLAECDIVNVEGRKYAERLKAAGVLKGLVQYPGSIHSFMNHAVQAELHGQPMDIGHRALRETAEAINALFAACLKEE